MEYEDFFDWLACAVFEDDWDKNPEFYREIILRKMVRIGKVDIIGNNYELKNPSNKERSLLKEIVAESIDGIEKIFANPLGVTYGDPDQGEGNG